MAPHLSSGATKCLVTPASSKEKAMAQDTTKVKDPVCGMWIDPEKAAAKSEYEGDTYYFCAEGCKKQFDADPGAYLSSDD